MRKSAVYRRRLRIAAAAGILAKIVGVRPAPLPATIRPSLATLVDKAPEGDDWLHEIKFDGYRILVHIEGSSVRLISRNTLDWTHRFKAIAGELGRLKAKTAVLDGEVAAVNEKGVSDFGALQDALSTSGATGDLIYYAFDLLYLDGYDLRGCGLEDRKAALAKLLVGAPSRIHYSDHHAGEGPAFLKSACAMGLEGIVSKRRSAPYQAGRTSSWLKTKCVHREEFVVVGWTDPAGTRVGFGSLILGYYDEAGILHPAGKVGTGFDTKTLLQIRKRLDALPSRPMPFKTLPQTIVARTAHWVEPSLVAEVRYVEWTSDGSLRHPTFLGLREDKAAKEVVRATVGAGKG
jgi:bifunctional non-homologous end joining protein LigD